MSQPNDTTSSFTPEQVFATPVWLRKIVDHTRINSELVDRISNLENRFPSTKRSNAGGWHSPTDLHLNEDFSEIRRIIGTACAQCAVSLGFDFSQHHLRFSEMWANNNRFGNYNRAHVHPSSFLSGAYYVQVPPRSGNIEFYDPVRERTMQSLPLKQGASFNSQTLEFECTTGSLIIFPSWLQHSVQVNASDEERLSLSFNMIVETKPLPAPGVS